MVQVLPAVPSFLERATPYLRNIGVSAGSYLKKRWDKKAFENEMEKFRSKHKSDNQSENDSDAENDPSETPMDKINKVKNEDNSSNYESDLFSLYNKASAHLGEKKADALLKIYSDEKKLASKERIQERKEDVEAHKLTSDYREKLLEGYEGSKRTLMQLNRLEELNNENKLATASTAKIAESLGIPLSILSNPQSEEFQKLSQDLMSNITKYYGNRILQVEVESFLKTIPTLMNSKEGRERVIENMKLLQEPAQIAYEAYKDIRKKGGRVPLDLHERVLEKMEPQLDKLADRFRKSSDMVAAPTTQNQSKDFTVVIDPNGNKRWVPNNFVEQALQAGGRLQ